MSKRKNANGIGTWYYDEKRGLNIYRVAVGMNEKGGVRRKAFAGKTQEAALEKYREWERSGSFVSLNPDITMKDWSERWFNEYKEKIEESTAATYYITLNHIIKAFGNMKVKDVRAVHIEKYLDDMATKYGKSQCGKLRTMLGQILRKAEANELINKNPVPLADRISYRRMGKKVEKKKDAYSAYEAVLLMQNLPMTRIGHSIRLMFGTSMGPQEVLGLSSFDIAQDGSEVRICRAVKIKKGGAMYIGDVKAEKRERAIPVPPCCRASARYLRENSNGYILAGKKSNMPLHPNTYRNFFKSAVNIVHNQIKDVRVLTPGCCRHTYISHLEDRGVDFAVIQALAGQSTQAATISYIHPQSPAIFAAVDMIEKLLTGKAIINA